MTFTMIAGLTAIEHKQFEAQQEAKAAELYRIGDYAGALSALQEANKNNPIAEDCLKELADIQREFYR